MIDLLASLEELKEAKIIIDARRREDYIKGHVNGAINIPVGEVIKRDKPEEILDLFSFIGEEDLVVVYDDNLGLYSGRVVWSLEFIGHEKVKLLNTTFSEIKNLGCEVTVEEPEIKKKERRLRVKWDTLATHDYIRRVVEEDKAILIDVRERLNYLEGHIPKAISIPWKAFSGNKGLFKDKEAIIAVLKARGIPFEGEIITYCGGGGTLSGLAYYALRSVGIKRVRLYMKSFIEWRELNLVVEKVKDANYWDLYP